MKKSQLFHKMHDLKDAASARGQKIKIPQISEKIEEQIENMKTSKPLNKIKDLNTAAGAMKQQVSQSVNKSITTAQQVTDFTVKTATKLAQKEKRGFCITCNKTVIGAERLRYSLLEMIINRIPFSGFFIKPVWDAISDKFGLKDVLCHNCGSVIEVDKGISIGLLIGIIICPLLFAWITLKTGYSFFLRILCFMWMIAYTLVLYFNFILPGS